MPRRSWLALTGLFLALALVTTSWVRIDRRPPEWDYANHLEHALGCWHDLAGGRLGAISEASSFSPPVAPCTAALLYFVLPVGASTSQAAMLIFLAIGLSSVYALGRALWGPGAGLLAAFFVATAPFVVYSL